jgi:hypothetical protein
VADQHHGLDLVRHLVQHLEDDGRGGRVKLGLDLDVGILPQARRDPCQRLAGAPRWRAQHHLGGDPLPPQVLSHDLGGAATARGQGAIVIGKRGVVPARLCVAEEEQVLHLRP